MVQKAEGRLNFSVKLHQDFSHQRTATLDQAQLFLNALAPFTAEGLLANLFVQFPTQFERMPLNRRYLAELCQWFADYPLAIEFRHPSWHIPAVFDTFAKSSNLIWCNVDYPQNIGLPAFHFLPTNVLLIYAYMVVTRIGGKGRVRQNATITAIQTRN